MRRALAFLTLAGFAVFPLALGAQGIPEALKGKALVVRVIAVIDAASAAAPSALGAGADKAQNQAWKAESVKYTMPGTPVPFKLVGSNVAIIVQITPFEQEDGKGVTLIAQGQVWVRQPEGGLSYHTTVETLSVEYGETVLFFPLGLDNEGKASMKLEISITHGSDNNPDGGGASDKAVK